jgi:DNA polymerase III subunit epsilon
MTCWYEGPLAAFGAATTGADAEDDRIVSAALVVQDAAGSPPLVSRWLVNPGVPVPRAAALLHGLTDEFLHRNGRWPAPVFEEIGRSLARQCSAGVPLVVPDTTFWLTVLDRELRRHRACRLTRYVEPADLCVLDPCALDRHLDRFGTGRRSTVDLCARYGVRPADARDPAARALASLDVTRCLGRRFATRLGRLTAAELHRLQGMWHAAQAHRPAGWFAGTPRAGDDPAASWPLRPGPPEPRGGERV